MIVVPIEFTGDCWNNRHQVDEILDRVPAGEKITLDLRSEGPSLNYMGIRNKVDNWLTQRSQPPTDVIVTRWSNPAEYVPYTKSLCSNPSHFFSMAKDYWLDQIAETPHNSKLFGLFLGRMTLSRAVILYTVSTNWAHQLLCSQMNSVVNLPWKSAVPALTQEQLHVWLSLHQQYQMFNWYDQNNVQSLDNANVNDQYISPQSYIDTNRSLLTHYEKFAIEIVCETYVYGETFFPTEKTIRPIMASKPFLIFGPQYFLANLRSMGFKTYSSLWDESYDLHQGVERWQLMKTVIDRLAQLTTADRDSILLQAQNIAAYNRNRLSDITNWRVDLSRHDYKNF